MQEAAPKLKISKMESEKSHSLSSPENSMSKELQNSSKINSSEYTKSPEHGNFREKRNQIKRMTKLSMDENLSDNGLKHRKKRRNEGIFDEVSRQVVDLAELRDSIHTSRGR